MTTETRQLQFWDAASRQYHPSAHQGSLNPDDARIAACGRPWRIAKADRPLKPRYVVPHSIYSGHTIAQVQAQYGNWAHAHGLTHITAFAGRFTALGRFAGEVRRIDPDQYFAVELSEEPDFAMAA